MSVNEQMLRRENRFCNSCPACKFVYDPLIASANSLLHFIDEEDLDPPARCDVDNTLIEICDPCVISNEQFENWIDMMAFFIPELRNEIP